MTDASLDDFADEPFETVLLAEIVEHLTQPLRLVERVKRVQPEGRLVLTTTLGLYPDPDHNVALVVSSGVPVLV